MKQRDHSAIATLAAIAAISLTLVGCATTQPAGQTAEEPNKSLGFKSLRFSELKTPGGSAGAVDGKLARVEVPTAPDAVRPVDLASETDDLFERIRHGFSMPEINNDLVLYHQQWYMSRPDYLRRTVERSSRYMHFIVEEIEKRGMPMELALLPMVESSYNPMAYSRSKASGLWQFIPATGKRYNLDQDWWKDERRDIVASTGAALDYLQSIYEMHGDWQLALASYNWGEGAVGRAIAKNKAQGLPTDYESLTMPSETKNYVPKLQALKNIFRNPSLVADLGLPKIINRPYFATVTKDVDIDVKVAAKLAEMPVDEFLALNPAHNRPVIKAQTPIVVPDERLDTFKRNIAQLESDNKPLSYWQSYSLQRGDKLDKVAKRFGVSVVTLKSINGLQARAKIAPGLTLLVPRQGADSQEVATVPAAPASAVAVAPATDSAKVVEPEPVAVEKSSPRSYTVRKGDTLPVLAKRFGVSVAEIKRANHLKSDKLAVGARLALGEPAPRTGAAIKVASATDDEKVSKRVKVEIKAEAGAKADTKAVAKKADARKPAAKVAHYKVRKGDTLYSIAKQFKVDTDDILRWNRVSPATLTPGTTLTIQLAQNP